MSGIDRLLQNAFGGVDGHFSVTGSATLSTTPVKISLPNAKSQSVFRLKIVNASTANQLAYMIVDKDSATPSFAADTTSTGGSLVLAGTVEFLPLMSSKDLYVVGSAPSTLWQITINLQ